MRKSWSKEEIEIVTREYKKNPKCVLLRLIKILGRTKGSIHHKAYKLGLTDWKHGGVAKGGKQPWCVKNSPFKKGNKHIKWKGGIIRRPNHGYVYVYQPNHPHNVGHYVKEHRLVMEKHLGKYLKPNEAVHHRNGIKDDNRIKNLEIVKYAHRGKVVCPFCDKKFSIK